MTSIIAKVRNFLLVEKFFLIELFTFAFYISTTVTDLTTNYLIQDKLCQIRFNDTITFCQKLNNETGSAKDQILAASSIFNIYKNAIETIGLVVWSLFVGSYLDKHPNGTRPLLSLVLVVSSLAYSYYLVNVFQFGLDTNYLLLGSLATWVSGGTITFFTTAYRYIVVHYSNGTNAPIRFALFQLAARIGASLGSFLAGRLLVLKSHPEPGEPLRTYHWCYILAIGLNLASFVVIFFMPNVDEKKELPQKDQNEEIVSNVEDVPLEPPRQPNTYRKMEPWKLINRIFNLFNIIDTFRTLFRPQKVTTEEEDEQNAIRKRRRQIFFLFTLMCLYKITFNGMDNVLLQFAEQAYFWSTQTYANVNSISKLLSTILITFTSFVLVKRFHVEPRTLMLIGLISIFLAQCLIGTIISPLVYYLALPIGSLAGLISISIRAQLAVVVEVDDIGKIYSLLTTLETIFPFLGGAIYSELFVHTLSTYLGLVYHFSAFTFLISMIIFIISDLLSL